MIGEDGKRAVRALIMHIDICLPVVILAAPISVCCCDSPIRPADLSRSQSFIEITSQMAPRRATLAETT